MAFDGQSIFAINKKNGLVRISTSETPSEISGGEIKAQNKEVDYDRDSLMILGDKIYLRSESKSPFQIYDKETLQKIEIDYSPPDDVKQNLKWTNE